ncbi:MAG: hypothetical protein IKR86_03775 [Candidatus Methanomethylophilaceae archaeon]|nr:hypothetical protein [Candidatus Methanomethylophilaceae archaeon]
MRVHSNSFSADCPTPVPVWYIQAISLEASATPMSEALPSSFSAFFPDAGTAVPSMYQTPVL